MPETIKIFIASSAEVKDERKKSILILNQVNKNFSHLHLEAVLWEYDVTHGSQPGFDTIQKAINPLLEPCSLCVFIFHTKIGKYTREEFELTNQLQKKNFIFFKTGFSPVSKEERAAWNDLMDFKESLNDTVLYKDYKDIHQLELLLTQQLNLYLSQNHPLQQTSDKQVLSSETSALLKVLAEKQNEIEQLKAEKGLPDASTKQQLEQLEKEKQELIDELNQNKEIQAQQAREKQELEQRLAPQAAKDQLKQQALAAIEEKKYAEAEGLLKESAKESISDTASTFYELGKLSKLQLKFSEALHYFELAVKINPADFNMNMEAGVMLRDSGYNDKAIAHFEKALLIRSGEINEDESGLSYLNNELGIAYRRKGEYDKAIEHYNKALAIDKKHYGEEHPHIPIRYNNLGLVYYDKAEYDKAIEYYSKAIAIGKKFYGEENPGIAISYDNLGLAYNSKGENDKAIEHHNKALTIFKKSHGEEHPDVAICYNNIGLAYNNNGEYDKAIEYYTKAIDIDKKFYGEEHPYIATRYSNIGLAYNNKGDCNKAIEYYSRAITIGKKFYGEEHPDNAIRYNNLGIAYENTGEYDKAFEYYTKALDIFLKFLGAGHPSTKRVKENLDDCIKAKSK